MVGSLPYTENGLLVITLFDWPAIQKHLHFGHCENKIIVVFHFNLAISVYKSKILGKGNGSKCKVLWGAQLEERVRTLERHWEHCGKKPMGKNQWEPPKIQKAPIWLNLSSYDCHIFYFFIWTIAN